MEEGQEEAALPEVHPGPGRQDVGTMTPQFPFGLFQGRLPGPRVLHRGYYTGRWRLGPVPSWLIVPVLLLALVLASCQVIPGATPYTETSFSVAPGEKHPLAVELGAGGTVEGDFSVSGAENYIDFYITGPGGELAYGVVGAVGGPTLRMKAKGAGTYTLYFDHSFSFGASRQIALRYRKR